jgi:hypothetical protein
MIAGAGLAGLALGQGTNPARGGGLSPVEGPVAAAGHLTLLRPDRVFDGTGPEAHRGWVVLVRGERIERAGPADEIQVPPGARVLELCGMNLLPGLIDAHTHVLLHPYDEAPGTTRCSGSRRPSASAAPPTTSAPSCAPASPPSATWAPKGPATPTWA